MLAAHRGQLSDCAEEKISGEEIRDTMNTLVDWLGKTDDISISYDAGVPKSFLLEYSNDFGKNPPAMKYDVSDNIRDIDVVTWETTVKKADRVDYLMAVASGSIAGLIDIFYVGEFSLERANKWGAEQTNKFVKKIAQLNGYKGDDLSDAIKHLEKRFPLAADAKTPDFGGGLQHHLRDFSHHFSLGGLLCSMFTQFTGKVIGTDTSGAILIVELEDKTWIGRNFEEKILFGIVDWFFHMVSDMAGSNATAGKGTGIPGPIVSLIKELSAVPVFRDKKINEVEFHTWVSKLFNGTLLAKRDENGKIIETLKFDLRTEIGLLHEVGRQFVPVLINECLVRSLYFVRRLYIAIKDADIHSLSDIRNIDTSELLPFNNRVITRMITVASGVFTAVDTVDAAVRAGIKNGGINPKFFIDFAVRINIVGVGRFIIACKADGQFVSEDIQEAKAKRDHAAREYEKTIADLKCLTLSYEQLRVLYSIESLIIQDDIANTKSAETQELKSKWKEKWESEIIKGLHVAEGASSEFFMQENDIACYIDSECDAPWKYLVTMESALFNPYYPIFNDDTNKKYKRIKCRSKYLSDRFPNVQKSVVKEDISDLRKTYKQAAGTITGSTKNVVIGAVGTTAVVLASGGLAFAFAPAIATALVGETTLSGAALVSYSLAAIGGGSLAAGGLGMAGGTAIITGGGALIGILGGTGVSAVTTMNLLADDGYVLSECCKLLTISKSVLTGKFNYTNEVTDIHHKIASRIDDLTQQLEELSAKSKDQKKSESKEDHTKDKIRVAKKSVRYLKNTADALEKLVRRNSKNQTTQKMLIAGKQ